MIRPPQKVCETKTGLFTLRRGKRSENRGEPRLNRHVV